MPLEKLADECARADEWPLPGHGYTRCRWRSLAALAGTDLVLARLVEAHADARAILAELAPRPMVAGERWGVWAAEAADTRVTAVRRADGWSLSGTKPWCSGATLLTHALVTAHAGASSGLFAVALAQPGVQPSTPDWSTEGMRAADTRTVVFDGAAATEVGLPGAYLTRPGFWIGAIGVAACWYGGLVPLVYLLRRRVAETDDPHAAAHLGAVHTAASAARALLLASAAEVDARPVANHAVLARTVRSAVEQAARFTIDRVTRATGPGPLAHDAEHAKRVADLGVYIRQHHAERDLAAIGRDLTAEHSGLAL